MTSTLRRMQRTRTLAISIGVAMGVTLTTLGPHLAQAATLLPQAPALDHSDPPQETDLNSLSTLATPAG